MGKILHQETHLNDLYLVFLSVGLDLAVDSPADSAKSTGGLDGRRKLSTCCAYISFQLYNKHSEY